MSYAARRKVHSEFLLKDRTDLCNINDVRNFKRDENEGNFVQSVHEENYYKKKISPPLYTKELAIHLCFEPTLMLLKKYPQTFMHMDATGGIIKVTCCKDNCHHELMILNHIIVIRIEELKITVPLFEAITSMSNTDAIANQLREFL